MFLNTLLENSREDRIVSVHTDVHVCVLGKLEVGGIEKKQIKILRDTTH